MTAEGEAAPVTLTLLLACALLGVAVHSGVASEREQIIDLTGVRSPAPAADVQSVPSSAPGGTGRGAESPSPSRVETGAQNGRFGHTSLRLFEHGEIPLFDPPSSTLGGPRRSRAAEPTVGTQLPTMPADDGPSSYLIAVAAFGDGRETVRRIFLRNVAGLCDADLHGALLIDAVVTRPSFWERTLSPAGGGGGSAAGGARGGAGTTTASRLRQLDDGTHVSRSASDGDDGLSRRQWHAKVGRRLAERPASERDTTAAVWATGAGRWPAGSGEGFELGCERRPSPFQVALRHHERAVGDLLTREHHAAFWRNRHGFDFFCYVEDDLGWNAGSLLALQAELRSLDALVLANGSGRTSSGAAGGVRGMLGPGASAQGGGRYPGLAAAAAGIWTGLVRWEAVAGAQHLNDPTNRTGGLPALNRVPLASIAPNDLNWKPASGAVSVVRIGGGTRGAHQRVYFEPMNPFAASWMLPRPLLLAAWEGGRLPDFKGQASMAKEYYGGCWLLSQTFARGRKRRLGFQRLRKLLPCDGARLAPLLALHISDSKYTLGDGARHSVKLSMADHLRRACAKEAVGFGTEEWRALSPDAAASVRRRQKAAARRRGRLSNRTQAG